MLRRFLKKIRQEIEDEVLRIMEREFLGSIGINHNIPKSAYDVCF